MEKRLGIPLLQRKVGGKFGGGSLITPEAKDLMTRYEPFRKEARKAIEKIFRKYFYSSERRKPK